MILKPNIGKPNGRTGALLVAAVLLTMWLSLIVLIALGKATVEELKGLLWAVIGVVLGWPLPSPIQAPPEPSVRIVREPYSRAEDVRHE